MVDFNGDQVHPFRMHIELYRTLRTVSFLVRNYATAITQRARSTLKRMTEARADIAKQEWKLELRRRHQREQEVLDRTSDTSSTSNTSRKSMLSDATTCTPTSDDTDSDSDFDGGNHLHAANAGIVRFLLTAPSLDHAPEAALCNFQCFVPRCCHFTWIPCGWSSLTSGLLDFPRLLA
jgi:hypothetical protein